VTLGKVSDSKILELKERDMSLRQIASELGISHEAVRKRLKSIEGKDRVSTNPGDQRFTAASTKNKKLSTFSNAHESKASEKIGDTVNQVSAKKTPSVTISQGVNPSGNHSRDSLWGMEGVSPGVFSEIDDLFAAIKDFLENKGIELYRMQNGGYQVKGNREIVRFYITRRDSVKEEMG